jgi:hypothetical protein
MPVCHGIEGSGIDGGDVFQVAPRQRSLELILCALAASEQS